MAGCTCHVDEAYRQLDRECPTHGDAAEAARRVGVDDRRQYEWDFAAELAALPSMPDAQELAEPVVRALYGFYVAIGREDRVHLLVERVERAEFDESVDLEAARRELAEYVACVDDAVRLVRVAVGDLTVARAAPSATGAATNVLRAIAGAAAAEATLIAPAVRTMIDRTESAS